MKKSRSFKGYPYLFLAPFFIIFIAFSLFPMIYSLYVSFMKWDGVNEMTFVGIDNYTRLFTDPTFYKSLWNTVLVIVIAIPLQIFCGLIMAVLLKDFFNRARTALQFINYTPNITTPVAVGLVFAILFDTRIGAVNHILAAIGLSGDIDWLGQPGTARAVTIILLVWKYFGYMMVMFLAGLSTISADLYEAAKIDGASYFQTFCRITLPMLKPTFVFLTTTSLISGLQLFAEPQLLFSRTANAAGPKDSVLTAIMYMYDTAFQRFDFGYGAAIAYGLFLIILLLSITRIHRIAGEEDV